MIRTPQGLVVHRFNGDQVAQHTQEFADLYRATYSEEPQRSNPFYSRERFLERLDSYRRGDGFQALVAAQDGSWVAFLYGYELPATTRWWKGLTPTSGAQPPTLEFTREGGGRTRTHIDLVVAPAARRQGVATMLLDEMEGVHPGSRFTLTVRPDNEKALALYSARGYREVGTVQPFTDSPVYKVMILERSRTPSPPPPPTTQLRAAPEAHKRALG